MNKLNLKVTKTPKEIKNQIELLVECDSDLSDKSYTLALRQISENVDVPGFRKGKAPRDIVEKQVGVGYISQRAFESVFYDILTTVSRQEKLEIVNVLEVSSFELLPSKPLNFKVTVELKPEVKLGKYKNLKVKAKKIVYKKDKFIEKTLQKVVNNFVSFKKLADGKVKEGDLVTLDFEGKFEDGSEVPGGKAENFQAILEKDKFLPEFVEALKGVSVGETKDITVTFPEKYSEGFSGKKAYFKVIVNGIEEKILPEINDEFAKKVGLESLDALKQKIVEQMIELQEANSQRELENKLVDEIIKTSKFEVSDNMIDREVNYLLQDIRLQCEKGGINWNDFKADEKNKELFDKAKESAVKRISIDLVLGAIVKTENIAALKEEIDNDVKNRIAQLGEKYKHMENDPSFRNSAELVIVRNKAIDFLLKQNEPVWDEEVTEVIPD